MTRTPGSSDRIPAPAGPYSPSVRLGDLVFTAGQGPAHPDGSMADDITAQTSQCLVNVLEALRASGAEETDVAKLTVYLTRVEDFEAMNQVYATVFSEPYPARTTVYVGLPPGLLVEIDAVARIGTGS